MPENPWLVIFSGAKLSWCWAQRADSCVETKLMSEKKWRLSISIRCIAFIKVWQMLKHEHPFHTHTWEWCVCVCVCLEAGGRCANIEGVSFSAVVCLLITSDLKLRDSCPPPPPLLPTLYQSQPPPSPQPHTHQLTSAQLASPRLASAHPTALRNPSRFFLPALLNCE